MSDDINDLEKALAQVGNVGDLEQALDQAGNIDELNKALNQQDEQVLKSLEALGITLKSNRPIFFCVLEFSKSDRAKSACEKFNVINGVRTNQNQGKIIISIETPPNKVAQDDVETIGKSNGLKIVWHDSITKGK